MSDKGRHHQNLEEALNQTAALDLLYLETACHNALRAGEAPGTLTAALLQRAYLTWLAHENSVAEKTPENFLRIAYGIVDALERIKR